MKLSFSQIFHNILSSGKEATTEFRLWPLDVFGASAAEPPGTQTAHAILPCAYEDEADRARAAG